MELQKPAKPLPIPTEDSREYWEGCRRHELLVQSCNSCGKPQFYPRALCSHCFSTDLGWIQATGRGTVYSFTTVYRAPSPAFTSEVPYVIALIDLDEGVRMMSRLVDCDPEAVKVGGSVEVTFRDESPEISLPMFKLT